MQTAQTESADRRQHERMSLGRAANFEHERGLAPGRLVDISFFGALFELSDEQPFSAKSGYLVVPFSRDPEEAIRVLAKVVYRRDRSVGLGWEALMPEDIIKVRRLAEGCDRRYPWLLARPTHTLFWARLSV